MVDVARMQSIDDLYASGRGVPGRERDVDLHGAAAYATVPERVTIGFSPECR